MPMLTGLQVPSLACNVHFTDRNVMQRGNWISGFELELNFEGLENHKWNIPTDRRQIADEKNDSICLVIIVII